MTQAQKKYKVANITLNKNKPTQLTYDDLFDWVIWQFPKIQEGGGLCGAVRLSIPDHQWYPAIIYLKEKKVVVYGHVADQFPSPETASDHFYQNGKSSAK